LRTQLRRRLWWLSRSIVCPRSARHQQTNKREKSQQRNSKLFPAQTSPISFQGSKKTSLSQVWCLPLRVEPRYCRDTNTDSILRTTKLRWHFWWLSRSSRGQESVKHQ
jgi:hypothetical protein